MQPTPKVTSAAGPSKPYQSKMIDKIKTPNTTSDTTANESEAAIDISIVTKAWIRAARAECQLNLLRNLKKP